MIRYWVKSSFHMLESYRVFFWNSYQSNSFAEIVDQAPEHLCFRKGSRLMFRGFAEQWPRNLAFGAWMVLLNRENYLLGCFHLSFRFCGQCWSSFFLFSVMFYRFCGCVVWVQVGLLSPTSVSFSTLIERHAALLRCSKNKVDQAYRRNSARILFVGFFS